MGQYITTNNISLHARQNLDVSQAALEKSMVRLSSGQRINSASDDAAGMAIASRMSSQIRGMENAKRNAQDGISMVQVADGALGSQVQILQRMREIGVQAANGMLSQQDRNALHNEMQLLSDEHNEISTKTEFNDQQLLNGNITAMEIQVGANEGEVRSITIPNTTNAALNVGAETFSINNNGTATNEADDTWTSDITGTTGAAGAKGTTTAGHINFQTQANAQSALSVLDIAIDTVNGGRADVGSYQNRLEHVITGLDVFVSNTTAARSRIQDADFALETSNMAKNQILAQAGVAMLTQANQIPQNVLSLIK